jgi:nucleoside 2-deoxyribosyltransferase
MYIGDSKTVLIGGPIQHASGNDGHFSRHLKRLILYVATILERASYRVLSAHIAEDFGNLSLVDSAELVLRDYSWMQFCDVYIALFIKNNSQQYIRSDGTHVEIGWASAMHKPIILLGDDIPSEQNSHLVRGLGAISHVQFISIADIKRDPDTLITIVQNALETVKTPQE